MEAVLDRHIEITPDVRGGRPHIAGTRLTVADIVILNLRMGRSLEEIAGKYAITLGDAYAAMTYYYDHRADIDADITADETYAEAFRLQNRSVLREKLNIANVE